MLATALHGAENGFKAADPACQARLCFHVMGGEGATADHAELKMKYAISAAVTVHNTTDAELVKKVGEDGRKMFYHKRIRPGMPRLATAAKLFLFQAMPAFVQRVLVLDSDIVVLQPVCQLTDHFGEQIRQPGKDNVVISYAREQQNTYAEGSKNYSTAVNGGVAVHELVRMRLRIVAAEPTFQLHRRMLLFAAHGRQAVHDKQRQRVAPCAARVSHDVYASFAERGGAHCDPDCPLVCLSAAAKPLSGSRKIL